MCIIFDSAQYVNHTLVRVISTMQHQMLHQIERYVQFIFTAHH